MVASFNDWNNALSGRATYANIETRLNLDPRPAIHISLVQRNPSCEVGPKFLTPEQGTCDHGRRHKNQIQNGNR